jgi:hypothetical protein
MKIFFLSAFSTLLGLLSFAQKSSVTDLVIAEGSMPNITKDNKSNIHVVFGIGDSIMYTASINHGKNFSSPTLVAVLPKLFAGAMRGPQIACTTNGIVITGNTKEGDIYAYYKENAGKWSSARRVNDIGSVSKEALMALSGDEMNVFAAWLDTRENNGKGQRLFGARSSDGGKTWSKNLLVYQSPDKTICECCKPSVVMRGNKVYSMFRNQVNGSRDLYLATSIDYGRTFNEIQKLGTGTWKLNACPMDGGGLALDKNGTPVTVWRREGKIYVCTPAEPETELAEGRGCSIEIINGRKVFAWSSNGEVMVMKAGGEMQSLGKGSLPLLKGTDNEHVICVWENDKRIHAQVVEL